MPLEKPKVDLVSVADIVRDVLVAEDAPFLLDSKEEWTELLQIILRDMNVHGKNLSENTFKVSQIISLTCSPQQMKHVRQTCSRL